MLSVIIKSKKDKKRRYKNELMTYKMVNLIH